MEVREDGPISSTQVNHAMVEPFDFDSPRVHIPEVEYSNNDEINRIVDEGFERIAEKLLKVGIEDFE